MTEPPIDPKLEALVAFLKGAASAIPFAGGVVSEVGNLYLNPLEKRKQQWMIEVNQALEDIRRKYDLLPESLRNDERFISFLYQSTIVALKNHRREKIDALRNALVAIANPEQFSEDLAFQFLRYIDELSVTHLAMLKCFHNHEEQFAQFNELEQVYRELQLLIGSSIERGAFRSFLYDLDAKFLIRTADLDELSEHASKESFLLLEDSAKRPFEITDLGRSFLTFIDHPQ